MRRRELALRLQQQPNQRQIQQPQRRQRQLQQRQLQPQRNLNWQKLPKQWDINQQRSQTGNVINPPFSRPFFKNLILPPTTSQHKIQQTTVSLSQPLQKYQTQNYRQKMFNAPNSFKLKTPAKIVNFKQSLTPKRQDLNKLTRKIVSNSADTVDLNSALQTLLTSDTVQARSQLYTNNLQTQYQNLLLQNILQNKQPPYFYGQYPWWQFYPVKEEDFVKNLIQNGPQFASTTALPAVPYPFTTYSVDPFSRVRKTLINADTLGGKGVNQKEIRSFLRKQKSDTSLFQQGDDDDNDEAQRELENEHLLTLKDYEDFIAHPTNKNILEEEVSSEDVTGDIRSMDNIIDGDDDDEIIAEATKMRETGLAKTALKTDTGTRKNVLREQESLRKLEHDKLIERYARPPANPIEYLTQIFEELDTDTKQEEAKSAASKKVSIDVAEKSINVTVPTYKLQPAIGITNTNQSLSEIKTAGTKDTHSGPNLNLTRTFTNSTQTDNGEDDELLEAVFKTLNKNNTTHESRSKRSPIVNADLELLANSQNTAFTSKTQSRFPTGDIATLALLVNKRDFIARKPLMDRTKDIFLSNFMKTKQSVSKLSYGEVKQLFKGITITNASNINKQLNGKGTVKRDTVYQGVIKSAMNTKHPFGRKDKNKLR